MELSAVLQLVELVRRLLLSFLLYRGALETAPELHPHLVLLVVGQVELVHEPLLALPPVRQAHPEWLSSKNFID
jgi:hypothetical protein